MDAVAIEEIVVSLCTVMVVWKLLKVTVGGYSWKCCALIRPVSRMEERNVIVSMDHKEQSAKKLQLLLCGFRVRKFRSLFWCYEEILDVVGPFALEKIIVAAVDACSVSLLCV